MHNLELLMVNNFLLFPLLAFAGSFFLAIFRVQEGSLTIFLFLGLFLTLELFLHKHLGLTLLFFKDVLELEPMVGGESHFKGTFLGLYLLLHLVVHSLALSWE
mmetsp:Transcript_1693/g.1620  ORF Transcript_1693/g.1620 Transcript_1693/m.1620 type:complete len:103 (+) Transcript_1693:423-731(+)